MLPTLPDRTTIRALTPFLFLCSLIFAGPALADDYADARAEMITAYQVRDFPAMELAAGKALEALATEFGSNLQVAGTKCRQRGLELRFLIHGGSSPQAALECQTALVPGG